MRLPFGSLLYGTAAEGIKPRFGSRLSLYFRGSPIPAVIILVRDGCAATFQNIGIDDVLGMVEQTHLRHARHPQLQKLPDFSDPGFDRLPSCDCYCAAAWHAAQRPQALYGHPRCDCAFDAAYSRKVARTQERSLI